MYYNRSFTVYHIAGSSLVSFMPRCSETDYIQSGTENFSSFWTHFFWHPTAATT